MTHHTDDQYLMDAVLSCPHTITHESITLHFSPKQAGHNALAQLRHRLAAAAHGMEQDAVRYQALVESGNFVPSPFDNGMWGLRASSSPSTKAELDAAVDRVIAAQAKQGGV